jgi:hypothetical protein
MMSEEFDKLVVAYLEVGLRGVEIICEAVVEVLFRIGMGIAVLLVSIAMIPFWVIGKTVPQKQVTNAEVIANGEQ